MDFLESITIEQISEISWPGAFVVCTFIFFFTIPKWSPLVIRAATAIGNASTERRRIFIKQVIGEYHGSDDELERREVCAKSIQSKIEEKQTNSVRGIHRRIDDLYKENAKLGVAMSKISGSRIHNGGFDELMAMVKNLYNKKNESEK